jgi:hypothetical protein
VASAPARGDLSRWLKNLLTSKGLLVELLKAPAAGGWDNDPGQPSSKFKQYVTLLPLDASAPTGSMEDPAEMWAFPYILASTGVNHDQVEGQADKARRIVNEIGRVNVTLGGEVWRVYDARINSIGGVDITRAIDPNEYTQRDVVMVRISKERP